MRETQGEVTFFPHFSYLPTLSSCTQLPSKPGTPNFFPATKILVILEFAGDVPVLCAKHVRTHLYAWQRLLGDKRLFIALPSRP